MIVKMKKITLVTAAKHANAAVGQLRKLGLMHIKYMREPAADAITSFEHRIRNIDKALGFMSGASLQKKCLEKEELASYVKEVVSLGGQKKKFAEKLTRLRETRVWHREWGNVSSHTLAELKKSGLFIKLYTCSKDALKGISKDKLVCTLHKKANEVYIALLSAGEEESLGFTPLESRAKSATFAKGELPLTGFKEIEAPHEDAYFLQKKISAVEEEVERADKRIKELSIYRDCFAAHKKEILKSLEFYRVRFSMIHTEGVYFLEGFCPKNAVSKITAAAKLAGWATIIRDPEISEEAPTLIKNPGWIDIIKPVFQFMGTLPGYKEFDISFPFLVFLSVFFAMLIGDAGYGILFSLITLGLQRKLKKVPKAVFFLMYTMSFSAIIWGAASGTWFGAEQIARLPFLRNLVVQKLYSFSDANILFLMYVCFLIGAVHMTIARVMTGFRYINSLYALAQAGWICILWGMFFVVNKMVLDSPFPGFAVPLLWAGVILVVLFSNVKKNMVKGAVVTAANLPLKLINVFGDILSYLRLFAVGYASVMIAVSFNQMALMAGFSNPIRALGAAAILFIGHTLNILLGLMSVLVHGIRLNMLEFSGQMDMEWAGKEYSPFKE